jgi:hypothetical protein
VAGAEYPDVIEGRSAGAKLSAATLSGVWYALKLVLLDMSLHGPVLPIFVLQQVGSYLGYTGHGTDAFGKAARDPKLTFVRIVLTLDFFRKTAPGVTGTRSSRCGKGGVRILRVQQFVA